MRVTASSPEMISPPAFGGASVTAATDCVAARSRDAELGGRQTLHRFGLRGHDALQAGIARLGRPGGDRHQRGGGRAQHVVAGLGLPLDTEAVPVRGEGAHGGDARHAEQLGERDGHGAGIAVGRLGAGDDEVRRLPRDRGGQHPRGHECVGAAQRRIGHQHRLVRAHRERALDAAPAPRRGPSTRPSPRRRRPRPAGGPARGRTRRPGPGRRRRRCGRGDGRDRARECRWGWGRTSRGR